MTGTWRSRRGSLAESLAIGVLAFCLFRACRQAALHGHDVPSLLAGLDRPDVLHALHPGYFATIRALARLTGVSGWELLCLASALGAACFAVGVHRAAAVAAPADPVRARFVTAIAVLSPAVVHFATVAELHAVFLGWVALAWWCCQRAVVVPPAASWRGWLLLAGAAAGWAATVHATGLLLAVMLPSWLMVEPGDRAVGERLRGGLWLAFALGVSWMIGFHGLRSMGTAADDDPGRYFAEFLPHGNLLAELGGTILNEWLEPFLVGSVVGAVGLVHRELRRRTLVLLALALVYALATASLLHGHLDERGAYVLPLALPLASLLADVVARRWWLAIVIATAGASIWQWHQPARGPADVALGRAAAELAAERPTRFLLGDLTEHDGVVVVDHRLACVVGRIALERIKQLVQPDQAGLGAWLAQQRALARSERRFLLVTDGAVALLGAELANFAAAWREFTAANPTERIERGALRGTALPP
jgi:hypothetical protein